MIEKAIILGLAITGIHVACWPGNIFSVVREKLATQFDDWFGKKASRYVQKPLWDCLPCMASFWTIYLTLKIDLILILAVSGLLVLIDQNIRHPDNERPADQ